jgi:hypothetical protein
MFRFRVCFDLEFQKSQWIKQLNDPLEVVDPEIEDIIELEKARQWKVGSEFIDFFIFWKNQTESNVLIFFIFYECVGTRTYTFRKFYVVVGDASGWIGYDE